MNDTAEEARLDDLHRRLAERVAAEAAIVTAYSGGADSALLAVVAHRVLGPKALAVTAVSPSLAGHARRAAREFTREQGIAHVEVCTDEFDRPEYVRNSGDRCAHCKSALLDQVEPLAAALGARVALATNLDDLTDHRPGQVTATRRGAIRPFVDVGLSKADVRALSRALGLRTHDRPADACLSSRVAYGDVVTPELLARIEQAEEVLRGLGFAQVRVRAHAGGSVARIEVEHRDIARLLGVRDIVTAALIAAGFRFVTADLAGFRSGSLNTLLPIIVKVG